MQLLISICLYKIVFPLHIEPLTVAIQYYSIIESYQFEHLLDLTSNLSELKTIFTRTHYNNIFSYLCPSAEIYIKWIKLPNTKF